MNPTQRILIIEDTYEVRDNLEELLGLYGYEVHAAADGPEGVRMAREILPDLILCDVMMPGMDGFGVLRILSEDDRTRLIPFLFLTARSEAEAFRKGMNLGAEDYITKPYDDTELLDAVAMRLRKREQRRAASVQPSSAALEKLRQGWGRQSFARRSTLFREGDKPLHAYYLHSGEIKVARVNDWGKELIVALCRAGDYLGYQALIQSAARSTTATVLEDAVVTPIPRDAFLESLYGNPEVASYFLRQLAENALLQEEKLMRLAYDPIRERMARALLDLHQNNDGQPFGIRREDLAALLGTTKETVSRNLTDFRNQGCLRIDGSEIEVLDSAALEKVLEGQ